MQNRCVTEDRRPPENDLTSIYRRRASPTLTAGPLLTSSTAICSTCTDYARAVLTAPLTRHRRRPGCSGIGILPQPRPTVDKGRLSTASPPPTWTFSAIRRRIAGSLTPGPGRALRKRCSFQLLGQHPGRLDRRKITNIAVAGASGVTRLRDIARMGWNQLTVRPQSNTTCSNLDAVAIPESSVPSKTPSGSPAWCRKAGPSSSTASRKAMDCIVTLSQMHPSGVFPNGAGGAVAGDPAFRDLAPRCPAGAVRCLNDRTAVSHMLWLLTQARCRCLAWIAGHRHHRWAPSGGGERLGAA